MTVGTSSVMVVRAVGAGVWGECVTTGANAPPPEGPAVRARIDPGRGELEVDVTPLVRAGGLVALSLSAPGGSAIEVASRERGDAGPRLEVSRGSGRARPVSGAQGLPAPPAGAVVRRQADRFGVAAGGAIQYESPARIARWLGELSALEPVWVRPDLNWADVQPRGPGTYDWSRPDRIIRGALAGGVRVLVQIGYTPAWARQPGQTVAQAPPRDPEAFARFAAVAVRHYAPLGVHDWEIWNEPNTARFWRPGADPRAYAALLDATAAAIRREDPSAVVVLGGLAPAGNGGGDMAPVAFLRAVYAAGGKCAFDAVGFHPYSYPQLPTSRAPHNAWRQMASASPSLRSVMTANGDERKQIWLTEFGAPTDGAATERVDPRRQAEILRLGYRLAAAEPWAGPLLWYTLADLGIPEGGREDSFGLARADGSLTPAWDAYVDAHRAALHAGS